MAPRAINFKAGSIIYMAGDKSDSVYLLKQGEITLSIKNIQSGEIDTPKVTSGNFFGVKSGLIFYPREETAKVTANSVVIEFTTKEFEDLAKKNTGIILKMLKAFSNQLRRVGKQVQSYVKTDLSTDNETDFFQIGEYYIKDRKYTQAICVYNRYLKYYENGKHSPTVRDRINMAQNALDSYGDGGGPALILKDSPADFKIDPPDNLNIDNIPDVGTPLSSSNESLDLGGIEVSQDEKNFNNALSLSSQNKYVEALSIFTKLKSSSDTNIEKMAYFESGKCYFNLKKFKECLQILGSYIKQFPENTNKNEAYYYIAFSYIRLGQKEKAGSFLNKIISTTETNQAINRKAQRLLKEI